MARRQDHFLLHGGLDLVTSPLAVPNGRLLAVKNYEPVEGGYGRLAGYERFDGRPSPSDAVYSILGFDAARAVAAKGDTLTGETSGATAEVIVDPVVTVDDAELAIADWDSGDVDDTSSQTKAPADAYKFASSLAQADVLSQKALLNGTLFTTLCEIDSLRLDYRMDVDGNTPYIRYLDDADPTAVGDGTLVSLTGFSWDGQTIYGTVTLTDLPKGRRFWFGSSLSVTSTLRRLRIRATGNACIVSEGHYVIAEISGTFQDDENLQVSGATKGVADGTPQSEGAGDLAKHESYLSAAAENRRADIAAVPGSGPVRGVWAYDGVVYAFRDNDADPATKCVMHKSTASGWTAVALGKKIGFDAGTDKPASGTTIAGQTSGATASLVATLLASGSWTGDDAAGTFYLKTVSGTFQNDERLRIPADTELGTGYAKVANTDTPAAGKVARDSSVATKWRLRPKSGDTLATFAAIVAGTLVHVRIDASNYIALDVSAVSDDGTYLILDLTAAATTAGTVADDAAVSVRLKASPVAVADGVAGDIELDPGGRFEFRNHNFLGQSDTRYMYGVDGKNPAFEWDGTEYRPIVTGLLAGKEKPKHLAIQSEHLLLAYPGGSLQNSATGKPLDWTVTAGAAEIATGQEINGLVEGVGAGNTAVLGANRIQILYGTDKETWDLRDQSGEEAGAVEWSGQMMGEPVYMDNRGVRSIRSTPAYSNFNIGTMTYPVQPWLERQRAGGAVPVSSMRVRARDMYRVFFDTKIGLSIYFGRGKPECSLVELLHAVRCSCSFEADDGVERVFFGSDDGWVFEMEKGRSFDGEQIEWFARLPFNHVNSPSHDIRFHKADLQVDVEAKASLRVGASFDYGDNPEAFLGEAAALYGGGAMWNEVEWSDFYWDSPLETVGQFHFSGIGSNVSLLIYGLSALELPHVLTGVTLHYSNRRLRR